MASQITAQEQLLIELINRARLDPVGEAARMGYERALMPALPKPPLAWSEALGQATGLHAEWMLATGVYSDIGEGGSRPLDRILASGYALSGEWVVSYLQTLGMDLSGVEVDPTEWIMAQYAYFYSDAGAGNAQGLPAILGDYNEIGLGQAVGWWTHPEWRGDRAHLALRPEHRQVRPGAPDRRGLR